MTRTIIAILASIIFWVVGASAHTVDIEKLARADFEKLIPEGTKNLPALKALSKFQPQLVTGTRASLPLSLRELGYGFREAFTNSDEQLARWVTQFQHDIGELETYHFRSTRHSHKALGCRQNQ